MDPIKKETDSPEHLPTCLPHPAAPLLTSTVSEEPKCCPERKQTYIGIDIHIIVNDELLSYLFSQDQIH